LSHGELEDDRAVFLLLLHYLHLIGMFDQLARQVLEQVLHRQLAEAN
jgi:hypothetical protein